MVLVGPLPFRELVGGPKGRLEHAQNGHPIFLFLADSASISAQIVSILWLPLILALHRRHCSTP